MHTAGDKKTIEIGYDSRRLGDFSTKIHTINRLGFTPGLRPIILEIPRNDRAELNHWAKVLATKCGLDRSQRLLTAASFEQILDDRGDPGFCVLITDGERISQDLQARILAHRTYRLPRPPVFVVVTEVDPIHLKQPGAWSDDFRSYFAWHGTWPEITERRRDWPPIFRETIKVLERREKTIDELRADGPTKITTAALEKLKRFNFSAAAGSATIIQMAADAYAAMRQREDPCITEEHLPDPLPVRRPSSFPPPSVEAGVALH